MTPLLLVVVVVLVRGVAGTVVAAVVGGVALSVGVVWWWARVVEPWLFAPRGGRPWSHVVLPVERSSPSPSEGERHVLFARALAYVATRYVAECEDELDRDREMRR